MRAYAETERPTRRVYYCASGNGTCMEPPVCIIQDQTGSRYACEKHAQEALHAATNPGE